MIHTFNLYGCTACGWHWWDSPEDQKEHDDYSAQSIHDTYRANCAADMPVMLVAQFRTAIMDRDNPQQTRIPCHDALNTGGQHVYTCQRPFGHHSHHKSGNVMWDR